MRFIINKILIISILIFLIFAGCDEGLAPRKVTEKSFLTGTIVYVGGIDSWPKDSMTAVRVASFINYPFTDSLGIIKEILSGNAYFTVESLPLFVDSTNFSIEITNPPVLLKYIVVARQLDSNIASQQVIGVYTLSDDKTEPSTLLIEEGKSYKIKIEVDFKNLPPQPGDSAKFKWSGNGGK
ncbi:MAG: hypothetical protein HZB41_13065 [Ignavibacteriae bacterium]|nr:hypothetical protein [Ignavibacteriota bacterium]